MLGEEGAVPELATAGPRAPLLEPEQVLVLGWERDQSTEFERGAIERHGLSVMSAAEVRAEPEGAAARAVDRLSRSCERMLVHFDVDVIDFTDTPLSENTGRNRVRAPRFAGLTVTELNPDHVEEGALTLERFASDLAEALAPPPRA
jgi:arginase